MRRFFYAHSEIVKQNLAEHNNDSELSSPNSVLATKLVNLAINSELRLTDDIYHHWCRVLRAKLGDKSIVFDGLGGQCSVELIQVDKKKATVKILSHNLADNTEDYFSTIAIVMSRGDRMDYAIQKATELGATAIQLLTSHHGEVRLKNSQIDKKLAHWQQVAISACEQCGMNRPPLVLSPLSIEQWLQNEASEVHSSVGYLFADDYYQNYINSNPFKLVLAVPTQQEKQTIDVKSAILEHASANILESEVTQKRARFDILIGAEGGLSPEEYQLARQQEFLPWQIGNRVLRTETAPVVALSTLLCLTKETVLTS